MLGGHGKVGRFRHKKSAVIRYGTQTRKKTLLPRLERKNRAIVIVGQLEDMIANPECAYAVSEHEGKKRLDLRSLGYNKLLASGKIRIPILVRIDRFSKSAANKIEAAGGRIEKRST
jgi:ribosomal protein L15